MRDITHSHHNHMMYSAYGYLGRSKINLGFQQARFERILNTSIITLVTVSYLAFIAFEIFKV